MEGWLVWGVGSSEDLALEGWLVHGLGLGACQELHVGHGFQ